MRHSTAKIILPSTVVVLMVTLAAAADSGPTSLESRPETQMSSQEMEKFLEGLIRYLYRQRAAEQVHQHQMPSLDNYDPDDVADVPATKKQGSAEERSPDSANNSVIYPRPAGKWPWPMENSERDGPYFQQKRPTYGKRNSELINSLLGLPRFMKVVG